MSLYVWCFSLKCINYPNLFFSLYSLVVWPNYSHKVSINLVFHLAMYSKCLPQASHFTGIFHILCEFHWQSGVNIVFLTFTRDSKVCLEQQISLIYSPLVDFLNSHPYMKNQGLTHYETFKVCFYNMSNEWTSSKQTPSCELAPMFTGFVYFHLG